MVQKEKVIIIGSGIGGLTAAIILLKLGYEVTVIEKNREPGGMMRGYKRFGIECPVGIHYLGSFDKDQPLRRIFDYLGISSNIPMERMGSDGPVDRYMFDDFTFDFHSGIDRFEEDLHSQFPDENSQITSIMVTVRKLASVMYEMTFLFGNSNDFSIFSSMDYFKPMGDLFSELNCSRGLRSVLEVPCTWIGLPLKDCPVFYHHNVLLSYLFSSWRLKCGSSEMADAFSSRVKELGGKIILGDEVIKILADNRIASGVQLKSGELIKSEIIIAALHPKMMLRILQEGSVKPAYRNRINQIEDTTGMFSVHIGVDAKIHKELPYNIFKLKADMEGALTDAVFYQLRKSDKPDINILSAITGSGYSNWQEWENTFTGKRGDSYIEKKKNLAEDLISKAGDIFGSLNGYKMLDTYSPLTIRDWVNSPNGSAYGVMRSGRQLLKTASLNRTSVKGLYLAGQSVLAPGILGTSLGSLLTAKDIIGSELYKKEVLEKL
jgi:all-trans-retinol 13,14-reductase